MGFASPTASRATRSASGTVIRGMGARSFGRDRLADWFGDWGDVVVKEVVWLTRLSKLVCGGICGGALLEEFVRPYFLRDWIRELAVGSEEPEAHLEDSIAV